MMRQTMKCKHSDTAEQRLERGYTPDPNSGCWLWVRGQRNKKSLYGSLTFKRKVIYAHRLSYETFVGPVPPGLDVLHKCDTPACVNPQHLWVGTHTENMRDCMEKGRNPTMLKRSHCKQGHSLIGLNVKLTKKNGKIERLCKECSNLKQRARYINAGENLIVKKSKKGFYRNCRICSNAYSKEYQKSKRV